MKQKLNCPYFCQIIASLIMFLFFVFTLSGCYIHTKSEKRTDALVDQRDQKSYKTIKIGSQTWMAENLSFKTPKGSWCYDKDESNCNKYGRFYNYEAALKACPDGWHLPSKREWKKLRKTLGWNPGYKMKVPDQLSKNEEKNTNSSGFSALPFGSASYSRGELNFYNNGFCSYWSSTNYPKPPFLWRLMYRIIVGELIQESDYNDAYKAELLAKSGFMLVLPSSKNGVEQIRCVKNKK